MTFPELAAFLKSRRDRVKPGDVGLPVGPRRRVPGLRREEVAQLAGLSADYYTELEQGRGAQPSEQTLAALARALRLAGDERDHLYHLADRRVPRPRTAPPPMSSRRSSASSTSSPVRPRRSSPTSMRRSSRTRRPPP